MRGLSIILLTLFAVVLGFTNPAFTAEIKVGSIDAQRVLNESKKANESAKSVEEFAKGKEKLLENDKKEIEKMDEEYQKKISILIK
jgi:Skp family chaperone for outer membrane proteins